MAYSYEELKDLAVEIFKTGAKEPDDLIGLLSIANEMYEHDAVRSKKIMLKVRQTAQERCLKDVAFFDTYNEALRLLARKCKDFDAYMLYVEKNREPEEMFYLPRRRLFLRLGIIQKMQALLDDEADILSVSMPPGTGKGELPNAKLLTPTGFMRFGDVKAGDKVISGTGKVSTVLGVYPKPKMPVYEVTFDDGSKVKCSQDHIWHVQTRDDRRRTGKYRDVELKDMLDNFRVENGKRANYSIDYVPKIDFKEKEYPIHPYVLGVLIGDGSLTEGNLSISNPDEQIRKTLLDFLPNGYELTYRGGVDYYIKEGYSERNVLGRYTKCTLKRQLEDIGLYGKHSYEKYIPEEYLYGSYEQRLWLLKGLLDTDGYSQNKGVEYTTTSNRLAEDVRELVHSLGGYCSVKIKENCGYKKDGEFVKCRDAYRLTIQFSANHPNPFNLTRKAEKYTPKRTIWKRYITDIKYVEDAETICIYIDDESHLYITDDYIITHNTTLGEFFMSFVMGHYPNTPNLMSSHSGYMTRMFYMAVLNIIKSNEYCWKEVFPKVQFESTNAKEETINLGRWQPFQTLTCRPIRASLTGVTRCEGFLYCDDLVSGIEEALSKERLDKLYGEYTTDLKSRKKMLAKEIHIATRWSVHDVIGRLERQYENDPRAMFIAVPDIDPETGESNFNYDYNVGFDEKYFADMAMTMDDVSYRCLFKSDPIEREGLLYHPEELKRYLGGLPDKESDAILSVCDTKDTGNDFNALIVVYQYGNNFYLEDVVFKNIDPGTLDQLNSDMLVKHSVQECQFESNKEGSRTAVEVEKLVKEKGGRCHITKKYSTQNKETKIIVNSSWVKEHVYFKDVSEYEPKSDYGVFMSQLCSYTQLGKNPHDDAPDVMAMLALFVDSLYGSKVEIASRADIGF